jgi:hypothetical protein
LKREGRRGRAELGARSGRAKMQLGESIWNRRVEARGQKRE